MNFWTPLHAAEQFFNVGESLWQWLRYHRAWVVEFLTVGEGQFSSASTGGGGDGAYHCFTVRPCCPSWPQTDLFPGPGNPFPKVGASAKYFSTTALLHPPAQPYVPHPCQCSQAKKVTCESVREDCEPWEWAVVAEISHPLLPEVGRLHSPVCHVCHSQNTEHAFQQHNEHFRLGHNLQKCCPSCCYWCERSQIRLSDFASSQQGNNFCPMAAANSLLAPKQSLVLCWFEWTNQILWRRWPFTLFPFVAHHMTIFFFSVYPQLISTTGNRFCH